ncbi:MAG: hypothetical protein ACJAU6_001664 [Alphaproteobacteria bacterium]
MRQIQAGIRKGPRQASYIWKGDFDLPEGLFIQTVLIPGVAAAFAAGLLWFVGGGDRGFAAASGAIGIGVLAAYLAVLGAPPAPPAAAMQKLFYIVAGGTLLGILLDMLRAPIGMTRVLGALAPTIIIVWLAWRPLMGLDWGEDWMLALKVVAFAAIAGAILSSLYRDRGAAVESGVLVLVAAAGLAGLAFFGSSAVVAQMSGALAAASGGLLLWNWPFSRHGFAAAGVLGAGGALVSLAAILLLFSETEPLALLVLAGVFVTGAAARRAAPGRGTFSRAARPVVLGVIAAIPALAALGVAFLAGGDDSGY